MTLHGIHVNAYNQAVAATLKNGRPGLVKTLDFGPDWAALKAQYGIHFLLGRVWCDDDSALTPTPEAAAERLWRRVWDRIARHAFSLDAVETPWNEIYQRGAQELAAHARAARRFCELAHHEGVRVAVGCFSVGNPEPDELAAYFAPALEVADYLAVHEYWTPDHFNAPWWVGRWRLLLDALPASLRRPVIISECGIDGGLEGRDASRAGWRAYGMPPDAYVADLQEYMDHLDGDVVGVAVFNCGDYAGGRWGAFEIADTSAVETWLRAGPQHWTPAPAPVPVPVPVPIPVPVPTPAPNGYVVGPGVLATMEAEGDTPASHEAYVVDGLSLTMGESGQMYVYTPRTGVVVYSPKVYPDHR